jgi:hypothetical protein
LKDKIDDQDPDSFGEAGHLFAGYFLPFPGKNWGRKGDGFVTTISDDPPQLNWIYIEKDTYEIRALVLRQSHTQLDLGIAQRLTRD